MLHKRTLCAVRLGQLFGSWPRLDCALPRDPQAVARLLKFRGWRLHFEDLIDGRHRVRSQVGVQSPRATLRVFRCHRVWNLVQEVGLFLWVGLHFLFLFCLDEAQFVDV